MGELIIMMAVLIGLAAVGIGVLYLGKGAKLKGTAFYGLELLNMLLIYINMTAQPSNVYTGKIIAGVCLVANIAAVVLRQKQTKVAYGLVSVVAVLACAQMYFL